MSLDRPEYWRYFGDSSGDAADALRERAEGALGLDELTDERLLRLLRRSVELLEHVTGRFFRPRTGALTVDGNAAQRLFLPHPVIDTSQDEDAETVAITVDGDADPLDADTFTVTSGAMPGPDDPRLNPMATLKRTGAWTAGDSRTRWPEGEGNIEITATWGYVEADGATPEPILDALARLVVLALDAGTASAGSAPSASSIMSEAVDGRSYTYGTQAASYGLTLDRQTDIVLRAYTRPPDVQVSRGRGDLARAARQTRW